jgi:hypothetical protein
MGVLKMDIWHANRKAGLMQHRHKQLFSEVDELMEAVVLDDNNSNFNELETQLI